MVVRNKPVTSHPLATEVAGQILQASAREMMKSNEQSSEDGVKKNAISSLKVVEKSLQSASVLQSVANERSSLVSPGEHQQQHPMGTSQKDVSVFKDGKKNASVTENRKRSGDNSAITSQPKTVRIEIPSNTRVVNLGKKKRLILAKILPRWDPPVAPKQSEVATARTTSSNHVGNGDFKPSHAPQIVAEAGSRLGTDKPSNSIQLPPTSSSQKTVVAIKNNSDTVKINSLKLNPDQRQLGNNLTLVPAEVSHQQTVPTGPAKKGRISPPATLKQRPSRCFDPEEEPKSVNLPDSVDMSGDASSSASTSLPPTIDLPSELVRSSISLSPPFPETKVKSIFDISDIDNSATKKNLAKVTRLFPTAETNTNAGLQPLSDTKVVWFQSEESSTNPGSVAPPVQFSLTPLQPFCQVPNQVIASPVVWTLTSEVGNFTSNSTSGNFSLPSSSQVPKGASTVGHSSFLNTSHKVVPTKTLPTSNGQAKLSIITPTQQQKSPEKKKLKRGIKGTTAPNFFVPCSAPSAGSDFSSMIDMVLKKSKEVEKPAAIEKKPSPSPKLTKAKNDRADTDSPQVLIRPKVEPGSSMSTRISRRRDQRISQELSHQQTASVAGGSSVTSSTVASEMNLSQVFVRSKLEDKVQGDLLKKRKLEEKLQRKEERRKAKKIFKGFSQVKEEKNVLPKMKFSKAVPINGVKRVLKSTGDLVEVESDKKRKISQCDSETKADKRTFMSEEERALMDSLLQVGSAAVQHNVVAPVVRRAQEVTPSVVYSLLDQFEMSQTQDLDMLGMDVPSLDDLL